MDKDKEEGDTAKKPEDEPIDKETQELIDEMLAEQQAALYQEQDEEEQAKANDQKQRAYEQMLIEKQIKEQGHKKKRSVQQKKQEEEDSEESYYDEEEEGEQSEGQVSDDDIFDKIGKGFKDFKKKFSKDDKNDQKQKEQKVVQARLQPKKKSMLDVVNDQTGVIEVYKFNIPQARSNASLEQSTLSSSQNGTMSLDDPEKSGLFDSGNKSPRKT